MMSVILRIWHDGAAEETETILLRTGIDASCRPVTTALISLSCAREGESDLCVDNRPESRPGDSDLLSLLLIAILFYTAAY